MIFFYRSGAQCLVCPNPSGTGHIGIKTSDLRERGWGANDDDFRKVLPRADQPSVQLATPGDVAAVRGRMH